jgi:AraC-like DNA-binding protein
MRILGIFLLLMSVKFGRLWGMPYLEDISHELADLYRKFAVSCIVLLGPCAYLLWRSFRSPALKPDFRYFLPVLPAAVLILSASWEAYDQYRICLLANIVLIAYMTWIGVEGFIYRRQARHSLYHLMFALVSLGLSSVYASFQSARMGIAFLFGLLLYSLVFYVLSDAIPRRQSEKRRETKKNGTNNSDVAIKSKINHLFDAEKVYRQEDISLPKLSELLGEPLHDVSRAINQEIGLNFNDMVNQYRIRDARQFLQTESREDKILCVALDCGFKSIATFNRAFKKYTGTTPSEFRQQHNPRTNGNVLTAHSEIDTQFIS